MEAEATSQTRAVDELLDAGQSNGASKPPLYRTNADMMAPNRALARIPTSLLRRKGILPLPGPRTVRVLLPQRVGNQDSTVAFADVPAVYGPGALQVLQQLGSQSIR